jgi:hypothetical protein
MNSYSDDSDEALNASSLQFLRSVKHFIATFFYTALKASLAHLAELVETGPMRVQVCSS